MKAEILQHIKVAMIITIAYLLTGCKSSNQSNAEKISPIEFPKGMVQVAVYYFPNWGPIWESEWKVIKIAKPKFEGHQQPKVPLWGYTDENDPQAMEQKINAAVDCGIDAFIFDWYYFDEDFSSEVDPIPGHWDGPKYLYKALESGYLHATNNDKIKFALMWCNHDMGKVKGAIKPETFESLTDYVINKYFKHPSYWKIDGCPYFSIWQINKLIETYGGDSIKTAEAIELFRNKVKAAGFPDLNLNVMLPGLSTGNINNTIEKLKINSTTTYHFLGHVNFPDFPSLEYSKVADSYYKSVGYGGGINGLSKPAKSISVPYYINVAMGWDSSPRCGDDPDWMTKRDYPFGAVLVNNTPYLFKKALAQAKVLTVLKPEKDRIITINSWNEWGEGSYLEPDSINGMEYLEAIKAVFGSSMNE